MEVEVVMYVCGSKDMLECNMVEDIKVVVEMMDCGVIGLDVVKVLFVGGFDDVVESVLNMLK